MKCLLYTKTILNKSEKVQILDETVFISDCANTLGKDIHPTKGK